MLKNKVFIIKNYFLNIILGFSIIILIFMILVVIETIDDNKQNIQKEEIENIKNVQIIQNKQSQNIINNVVNNSIKKIENSNKLEEYKNMPKDIKGHKVIGKLKIEKIKLETYILDKTTDENLNISVTKLEGPEINNIRKFLHNRT